MLGSIYMVLRLTLCALAVCPAEDGPHWRHSLVRDSNPRPLGYDNVHVSDSPRALSRDVVWEEQHQHRPVGLFSLRECLA